MDTSFDWNAKRAAEQRQRIAQLHRTFPASVRVSSPTPMPDFIRREYTRARLAGYGHWRAAGLAFVRHVGQMKRRLGR